MVIFLFIYLFGITRHKGIHLVETCYGKECMIPWFFFFLINFLFSRQVTMKEDSRLFRRYRVSSLNHVQSLHPRLRLQISRSEGR